MAEKPSSAGRPSLMRRPARSILLVALAFPAGCGSGREGGRAGGAPSGPTLLPVDSVLLAESDSVYIGRPGKPSLDPYDGSLYVPDQFSMQVYRFARDGYLLAIYGRPGDGPGEFRSPYVAFVPDESTVVVVQAGNARLMSFDRSSGEIFQDFNRSVHVEARRERLSADGGAVLLRELLHRLGLDTWLSDRIDDPRDPARTTHPTEELLRTLVLLQGQGWTDQEDVGVLRDDPLFRLAVSSRRGDHPLM